MLFESNELGSVSNHVIFAILMLPWWSTLMTISGGAEWYFGKARILHTQNGCGTADRKAWYSVSDVDVFATWMAATPVIQDVSSFHDLMTACEVHTCSYLCANWNKMCILLSSLFSVA